MSSELVELFEQLASVTQGVFAQHTFVVFAEPLLNELSLSCRLGLKELNVSLKACWLLCEIPKTDESSNQDQETPDVRPART